MKDACCARKQWQQQTAALWPAVKGSLAKVYKPCIRKSCPACRRGDKHPAWILSISSRGRRQTLYVPLAMVSILRKAIQNGRRLELLLQRAGPALIKRHRNSTRNP